MCVCVINWSYTCTSTRLLKQFNYSIRQRFSLPSEVFSISKTVFFSYSFSPYHLKASVITVSVCILFLLSIMFGFLLYWDFTMTNLFSYFQIMARAILHSDNCYRIPNVKLNGYMCRTNLASNTAFRGFGAPQGQFVCETWMTQIAKYLNINPEKVTIKLELWSTLLYWLL